jgi:micrococcal nuclease
VIKLLLAALLGITSASSLNGRAVRILDGDTIDVLDGNNESHRIRLYGIDAPEKAQDFGQVAKRFTSDLVAGKQVSVEILDTDKYGRSVGVVRVGNVVVNAELLRTGNAWLYTKYCREDFCRNWSRIEQAAKSAKQGLWSQQATPPWIWRKDNR